MVTEFGKFCRKLRAEHGESMAVMGKKLGITASYICAVEKGKRDVPLIWASKIMKEYNLSEEQVKELNYIMVLDSLSDREKLVLNEAISAVDRKDNNGSQQVLWEVIKILIGENTIEDKEFDMKMLKKILKCEVETINESKLIKTG